MDERTLELRPTPIRLKARRVRHEREHLCIAYPISDPSDWVLSSTPEGARDAWITKESARAKLRLAAITVIVEIEDLPDTKSGESSIPALLKPTQRATSAKENSLGRYEQVFQHQK